VSSRTLIVGAALLLTIAAIVAGMSLFGGRGPAAKDDWVSLFNGQDLAGWEPLHEPKVNHPGIGEWSVVDGAIATTAEKSLLRTVREWRDFEFEADYKSQEGSLTSIWLRGRVPLQVHNSGPGFAPDRRPGAIRDQYPPLVDATKPDGEWNHLQVRLQGDTLTSHLNGKLIQDGARGIKTWRESPLDGNVIDPGPIMLEAWHGVTLYKNLRIRPI